MKKLLKPFKRHSREIDEKDVPRRSRSETRGRKSESNEQRRPDNVESSHNTPVRPSTAAIAPAHPAIAVNGSGAFMNSNELIAQNNPIQSKSPKLGGDEKLMTQPHRRRFSEDVADRNIPTGTSEKLANGAVNSARRSTDLSRKAVPSTNGRQPPAAVSAAPVANRTVSTDAVAAARAASAPMHGQAIDPITKRPLDRQPTEVATPSAGIAPVSRYSTAQPEAPVATLPIREAPQSKKTPVVAKDRDAIASTAANGQNGSLAGLQPGIPSALESSAATRGAAPAVQPPHEEYAPLPKIPLTEPLFANTTSRNAPFVPDETPITAPPVKRLPTDIRLPEDFSLQDSVDVDRSTTHAPAVTHEVVQPTVHHIRHEIITREIHNHDVYHRILPIVDVRILPARHYILDQHNDFKLKEVPECCVPGRTNDEHRSWTILETCSKFPELWSKDRKTGPVERVGSKFTARTFAEKEGDTIEWVGKDGVARSERTWIHPPVSSSWGIEHGGTEPLYLDEFAPQPEIKYDYHVNGTRLQDMTVFDPSTVHERSFEETPEIRNINGQNVIAERTPATNPISRPTVVSHNSNRAERLRLVDDSFDDHRREPSRIETVNAGMTGIAI